MVQCPGPFYFKVKNKKSDLNQHFQGLPGFIYNIQFSVTPHESPQGHRPRAYLRSPALTFELRVRGWCCGGAGLAGLEGLYMEKVCPSVFNPLLVGLVLGMNMLGCRSIRHFGPEKTIIRRIAMELCLNSAHNNV